MMTPQQIRDLAAQEMSTFRFFLAEARDAARHGNHVWEDEMHMEADYHFQRAEALFRLARPLPLLELVA